MVQQKILLQGPFKSSQFHLQFPCVILLSELSGVVMDVDSSLKEIEQLIEQDGKQETESQVIDTFRNFLIGVTHDMMVFFCMQIFCWYVNTLWKVHFPQVFWSSTKIFLNWFVYIFLTETDSTWFYSAPYPMY